jgi:protein TonB
VPGARTVPSAEAVKSSSEVQRALAAASRALQEGRYVPPAENNALAHYLTVLEIEPDHAQAVAGLDTLAGLLLQQAQQALAGNDFEGALAGRRLAWDLRPQHPAMAFVDAEFADYGKALISDMSLALASGDLARAGEQIERAARFLPPDSPEVSAARARLAERRDRLAIDDRLAMAYERMAANNLTVPENDSAEFHLLALRTEYPNDEKVVSGLERLVDTILERSDEAILNDNFPAAATLLDKAAELGAPPQALTGRRAALETGARQKAAGEALLIAEAALTEASLQEELALAGAALKVEAVLAASESKAGEPELLTAVDEEPLQLASTTQIVVGPQSGAGAVIDSGSAELSELEILRMVEPAYPRRAWVRDIDGWIDVEFTVTAEGRTSAIEVTGARARGWFEQAAIDAVEQWEFRPSLENGRSVERRAKVRLQFKKD